MKLRRHPWLGLLLIPAIAWLALVFTTRGVLIRYDPLLASDTEPSFVESVACTYSSLIRTETVFSFGNRQNAECSPLYKFGSIPRCPSTIFTPCVCEEVPGQSMSIDPRYVEPAEDNL
jgi:hypothetical protein